jgi:hypothetical protein
MASKAQPKSTLNVLFIGNSFTSRNDLPGLIARLAAVRGKTFRHHLIFAGGAPLRAHWNAGKAAGAIREWKFDYVVLQEQSTLPVKNAARMHENIRLFDEVIRASGSKTVLYMTWARRKAPETQKAITDAYGQIGQELGATVVPVGAAWQRFLAKHDQPALHDKDDSHPTLAGSYLTACVFYAVLFGDSPEGIDDDISGLSGKEKTSLQMTALRTSRTGISAKRPTKKKPGL